MQHRQYTSIVGDLVLPLDKFSIFVPDSIVEGSKQHVLDHQKGNPISLSYRQSSRTPLGTIGTCTASHRAVTEWQDAGNADDTYHSKGLMACACCHDVPLFLCDIWTLGEQQHFAVALIGVLFQHLPLSATVGCLYNIGCVLDQSILKVCCLISLLWTLHLILDSTISYWNLPLNSLLALCCSICMLINSHVNLCLIHRSMRALVCLMERAMNAYGHNQQMSLLQKGLWWYVIVYCFWDLQRTRYLSIS